MSQQGESVTEPDGDTLKAILEVKAIAQNNYDHLVRINGSIERLDHRVEKLEFTGEREKGKREERMRWEKKQADEFKLILGAGLTAAGLVSGVVFGVLSLVLA